MSSPPLSQLEQFEDVDWTEVSTDAEVSSRWTLAVFLFGVALLAGAFLAQALGYADIPFLNGFEILDWLLVLSLFAMLMFLVIPLARRPRQTAYYWGRLRSHRLGVPSLVFVIGFFVVGLAGPYFVSEPDTLKVLNGYQPPVGMTVDTQWMMGECLGQVTNGMCHGTWQHPFGTGRLGRDVFAYVVLGTRTALKVAVVSTALIVPTGIGVGLLAAYSGGRTDRVLMRLAEILQTIPAVIIYLLFWQWNLEYRLLALIMLFGLMNWGGLARLVRNQALQLRERPYVQAAKSAGASRLEIMRSHLLPNISRSVLTNVTLQIPMLVLTEAALSFMVVDVPLSSEKGTLGDPSIYSWGRIIYIGIRSDSLFPGWWTGTIPNLALMLTIIMFHVFGRTLRDVLDPRTE
jgi:peptide/nickel transport system permease protein